MRPSSPARSPHGPWTPVRRRPDLAPDLVVPVPLARARLAERGHNQAWELARRIARALGVHAEATLLVRVRATAHQLALPPGEREGNVRGAFAVEPSRTAAVAGRRVLLVDDVMTTGSTAGEIARVLRGAGASFIAVAVVARVPRPGEP
jgi:ComF family protein